MMILRGSHSKATQTVVALSSHWTRLRRCGRHKSAAASASVSQSYMPVKQEDFIVHADQLAKLVILVDRTMVDQLVARSFNAWAEVPTRSVHFG